jgi:hypothetical protein
MKLGRGVWVLIGVLACTSLPCDLTIADVRVGEPDDLTPEALAAVQELFPTASIVGIGREREHGVRYYEVAVRDGDERIEIEVTADGTVGEIESMVAISDVPAAVRSGIESLTTGVSVMHVERHEIRGVPRGDVFVPVDPPLIAYEVEYQVDGVWKEVARGADGDPLALEEHEDDSSDDDSSESSDDDSSSSDSSDDDSSESSDDDGRTD